MEEEIGKNLTPLTLNGKDTLTRPKIDTSNCQPVVDLILPVYNEVGSIESVVLNFYNEIVTKLPSRLIIVEDGSTDGTKEKLSSLKRTMPVSLFSTSQRKGYLKGVSDGLKKCTSQWIFFSDSDGQYFPSDFWNLWENREGYDMIIGCKRYRQEGIHRIILSNGFHNITNNIFNLSLHDEDCGFRLIRKSLIDSVLNDVKYLKYSFWAEFTIRACLKGFKINEVPIDHASRTHGNSTIYVPSKIPLIILDQLNGLKNLYFDTRKGH
jgi:dolichol-phosphate mannosyltransferase